MAETKPISTPMQSSCKLTKFGSNYFEDPHLYRSLVGALQYATITKPEISFAVNRVCQFMSQPLVEHWKAVKRILRYLQGTLNFGLQFKPVTSSSGSFPLHAYCDADWGSDQDDRRSVSGACIFVGPNLISWWSKKQTLVARSTAEAEYRSMALLCTEILWVKSLFSDLQLPLSVPQIFCDNLSAVAIVHNPILHARTKHLELDLHFLREKVVAKDIQVFHIPGVDQIADIFTKALSLPSFTDFRTKLRVLDSAMPLQHS